MLSFSSCSSLFTILYVKSTKKSYASQVIKLVLATPGIKPLCPMRWTVRVESLRSIFEVISELLEEILEEYKENIEATCIAQPRWSCNGYDGKIYIRHYIRWYITFSYHRHTQKALYIDFEITCHYYINIIIINYYSYIIYSTCSKYFSIIIATVLRTYKLFV